MEHSNPFDLLNGEGPPAARAKPAGPQTKPQPARYAPGEPRSTGGGSSQRSGGGLPGSSSGGSGAPSAGGASSSGDGGNPWGAVIKGRLFEFYRAFQRVFVDAATGDVVLRFHRTDLVRVRPNGDVALNSGGLLAQTTLLSMNDALRPLGMEVMAGPNGAAEGDWALRFADGSAAAFRDGMCVRANSPADAARGRAVLLAYSGAAPSSEALSVALAQQAGGEPPAAGPRALPPGFAAAGAAAAPSVRAPPQARVSGPGGPAAAAASRVPPGFAAAGLPPHLAGAAAQQQQQQQQQAQQRAQPQAPGVTAQLNAVAERLAPLQLEQADGPHPHYSRPGPHYDDVEPEEDEACVVCLDAPRHVALIPCGHVVLCGACSRNVLASATKECPMCRVGIEEAVELA
ncbi:hypothetical protein Rsub_01769 [Raphidocelis subcapitata]|uniref:RING-type domain-containing protein n=1 Tax=Raphidocelis subcapitata TaxID=307507 RepID=A0A2V0NR00_9CHLO|nr:hypothetical protein Rsub_01769 [Raphidocelis subcapitata]|eukprot:GBF89052.1 hypothetical protein Rsub_01769 [Raphidocelis subcapitata]